MEGDQKLVASNALRSLKASASIQSLRTQVVTATRKPTSSAVASTSRSPTSVRSASGNPKDSSLMDGQLELDPAEEREEFRRLVFPPPVPGVANWGIPPDVSEPCDPALQAKLDHFRDLKKQGKHFNSSLMSNKSFRNPHLYAKLVEFVEVDESATNFPKALWNPFDVKKEWYSDSIAEAQKLKYEQTQASQASGKRTKIEFTSKSDSGKRSRDGETSQDRKPRERQGDRYRPYPKHSSHEDSSSRSRKNHRSD